jgi:hypothetical protein
MDHEQFIYRPLGAADAVIRVVAGARFEPYLEVRLG